MRRTRWHCAPTARWPSTGSSGSTSTASARSGWRGSQALLDRVGARRAALLRLDQHPLHHGDPHRHLGDGQARSASASCRRATSRSCGTSARPPATTSCTARGSARARSRAGISTMRGAMPPDCGPRPRTWRGRSAVELEERGLLGEPRRRRRGRAAGPVRAADARALEVVDGQQLMLEARMIKTPDEITLLNQACIDGRRRLRGALPVHAARRPRERVRRPRQQGPLRARLRVRRGRQRDLGRALLPASARLHRPRRCARATRPSSTSCTATSATAPATTAPSRSAARRRPCVDAYKRCRYYLDAAIAHDPAGRHHRPTSSRCGPRAAGVRLRRRGGRVRPAVRARRRA